MSFRRVVAMAALIAVGAAQAQVPESAPTEQSEPVAAGTAETQPAEAPAAAAAPAAAPASAAPSGPLFGDAKAGEGKAGACAACHGVDGNSTDHQYPKLAGQNEAYIARQLESFKSGKRANPIMAAFASSLSSQDMHDIGAFFATKLVLSGVADEAVLERATELYRGGDAALGVPACMACHGPDGRGMAGTGYPQLAGQWTDYVAAKLTEWKSGTTWGDDTNAKIMPEIVGRLSQADLTALASYVEGLHSAAAKPATP